MSSAGREAVDLAASAGLVLDPWQADVLEDFLGESAPNKWAALECGLIVPRQNGKGSIIEAVELAGLFLFGERLILHSAHEFKTSVEAFRRIRYLIDITPDLSRKVKRILANNNDMSIELVTGQRLRFVARSTGSGRGFTGDRVILDEAYNLSPETMAALFPTLSARPNPQVWYTSSAPLQTPPSDVLRRFCRRGREGGRRVAYVEYCADADAAQDDPAVWHEANPAFGIRIDAEFIESERDALGDEFARERLGVWFDEDTAGRVIPTADWLACRDDLSGPVGAVSFALDVSPDRASACFAVAAESGRGGTHVEITSSADELDYRAGTDWVIGRARELQMVWGGRLAVAAGSPAASLVDALDAAGVDVVEVSTADHAKACGTFYDAVMQVGVRHLGQRALDVAIAAADRKFSGDAWLWSRRNSTTDICPVVAVTLAKWLHDQAPAPVAGFVDLAAFIDEDD